jgi:hypothetical protein
MTMPRKDLLDNLMDKVKLVILDIAHDEDCAIRPDATDYKLLRDALRNVADIIESIKNRK